jgi:hypothetical protein
MIYDHFFSTALARLREERRYRVFADIERILRGARWQVRILQRAWSEKAAAWAGRCNTFATRGT